MSNLSLSLEDVQITMEYLLSKAKFLKEENEMTIGVYRRLMFGVITNLEIDKKQKRLITDLLNAIRQLPNHRTVVASLESTLLSLPILLQSRWDLLTMLAAQKLIPQINDVLFAEVMACAADQDLAARCSTMVLHMAFSESTYERCAAIIFRGLTSPVAATRNNVHRSWLCRIINLKNSQKCVEKILQLCREAVSSDRQQVWPVPHREINGLTCVDLKWSATLDEESFDEPTFSILAYHAVLIALKNASSQVKVKVEDDDFMVELGMEHFVAPATKQAVLVCVKYKLCPAKFEKAVLFETSSGRNPEFFDLIDDEMTKRFSKEGQTIFTKEKLKYRMEMLKAEETSKKGAHGKFYPAEDEGNLKVEVNLRSEINSMATLERFLNVQSATSEKYPSVAAVMETLSNKKIDERLFSQKIVIIVDIVTGQYNKRKFSRMIAAEFLFTTITQIPLRAVVDYTGDVLRRECRADFLFREKIFKMSMDLLKKDDENARPLTLVHCFTSTSYFEKSKIKEVWETVISLKAGEKKRKMSEMLAKVVSHSEISVETDVLHDMILCSLGIIPDRFDIQSTQLFVAAVSNLLNFRNETERIMLFQAIYYSPKLMELITKMFPSKSVKFGKKTCHLVLYMFTRFHLGSLEFYNGYELSIICRMIRFCRIAIHKFASDPMILGIAVDAICGFMPWEYIRERALTKDLSELNDPVERLICQNMRHHRLWVLLNEHNKEDTFVRICDFEKLPFGSFIVEIINNQNKDQETRENLAYQLCGKVQISTGYEEMHSNSLAFAILADKALELIAEAEKTKNSDWKKQYHTFVETLISIGAGFQHNSYSDLKMANSWLGKALLKMQNVTQKMYCA
uniref:Uncharacterized protein n=1 Tax=Caenorhabditis japonica TaxID=281687 RepID=A0A8R1HUC9_CAEJA